MRRAFRTPFNPSVVSSSSVVVSPFLWWGCIGYGSQSTKSGFKNRFSKHGLGVAAFLGMAGLYSIKRNEENLMDMVAQFANYPLTFEVANQFVESYLTIHQFSKFTENRNPSNGKRRLFFRGETLKEAHNTLRYGKSPIVIDLNGIVTPKVVDKTLHPHDAESPGTCRGLTGLTSDLASLAAYEAVHLIIPGKTKIAPTSLHATDANHNPKDQFVMAGLAKEDIFATVYRNPETGVFFKIEINQNFVGDVSCLELDEQMRGIIALLPESDVKQTLEHCINPELRCQDFYEKKLAPCVASHAAAVEARRLFQRVNLPDETGAVWFVNRLEHALSNGDDVVEDFRSDEAVDHANVLRTTDGRVFVRFGDQRGGNPGGFFMGHDNEPYYIKHAPANELVLTPDEEEAGLSVTTNDPRRMNSTRFQNEYLMGQLYRAFGIRVPKTHLIYFKKDGVDHVGIASKFERDLVRYDTYLDGDIVRTGWCDNKHFSSVLQRGGLVDFLLGDYDVIGLAFDNTLGKKSKLTGHLYPVRIDPGAGLLFKAKGTPLDLADDASDFLTNELGPGNWYDVFGQTFGLCFQGLLNDFDILSSAIATLEKVSPEQLAYTIRKYKYNDDALTDYVIDLVLKRREALLKKAKTLHQKLYVKKTGEEIVMSREKNQSSIAKVLNNSSWSFAFLSGLRSGSGFIGHRRRSSVVPTEVSDTAAVARKGSSFSMSGAISVDDAVVKKARALSNSLMRKSSLMVMNNQQETKKNTSFEQNELYMIFFGLAVVVVYAAVLQSLSFDGLAEESLIFDRKNPEKWREFGEVVAFEGDSNASSDSDEEEESETNLDSDSLIIASPKRM